MNTDPHSDNLIACHDCDLLQREITPAPGVVVKCVRCQQVLYRGPKGDFDNILAYTIAAVLAWIIGNSFPIAVLEVQGLSKAATLMETTIAMHNQGMDVIAVLVTATAVVAPAIFISALLYLLLPLRLGVVVPGFGPLFRLIHAARPWSMVEVLMLAVVVSMVKLSHLATARPGIGLWAYMALMLLIAAIMSSVTDHRLWAHYEDVRLHGGQPEDEAELA